MGLIERRRTELKAKLASLSNEFEHWKDITKAEGGLGRHHSQVRRVSATIDGALDPLRKTLNELAANAPDVLANGESWENEILAAHSIWEVFRSKLVLREDALFVKKLAACDDLAWECYSPALQPEDLDRKGPPLVYLSATWSPFAVSRDSNFQNEVKASARAPSALGDENFQKVLRQLPVPLLSIPWYQVFHLPGALIIAHEVGHVVEDDFGLTQEIGLALDGARLKFADVWKLWAREMFADAYGCCAMGPAFASAMIDLNATKVDSVKNEERTFGIYPTRNLRIRLLCETLRQTGHKASANDLLAGWESVYGKNEKMVDYLEELPKVVAALIAGPYRGKTLTGIISFPTTWAADIQQIGQNAAQTVPLTGQTDPRKLFAAAQWLHESAGPGVDTQKAYDHLVNQIVAKSTTAERWRNLQEHEISESKLAQLETADRARGATLRNLLLTPMLEEDPRPAGALRDRPES
jgi:hypothetical protein